MRSGTQVSTPDFGLYTDSVSWGWVGISQYNHIVTDSFLQKLFTTAPISLSHIVAFLFPWRCQRGFVWVINKTFLGLSWILYLGSLGVFGVRKEKRNSTLLLFALQLSAKEYQRYQRKACNKKSGILYKFRFSQIILSILTIY